MGLFNKKLNDREEACLDGRRVGWFGSYMLDGEETTTVATLGVMWRGDEMEQQPPGTMGGEELDRRAAGYSG